MRQQDRQRHHLRRFVGGVAEHDALVAGALVAALARRLGDALRDLVGLLGDELNDLQRRVAEGLGGVGVADFLDRLPDDLLEIELGVGRDLASEDHMVALDQRLARHAAPGVLLETRVEDRVGDVIADLVGVTFGDRF